EGSNYERQKIRGAFPAARVETLIDQGKLDEAQAVLKSDGQLMDPYAQARLGERMQRGASGALGAQAFQRADGAAATGGGSPAAPPTATFSPARTSVTE